jgi:ubiquinone/menaquinone biosynthesis C-methylase UbiE
VSTGDEADRIRDVYAGYARQDFASTKWSETNAGNRAIITERLRVLRDLVRESGVRPFAESAILDIGCGGGKFLSDLLTLGAVPSRLTGVDLLPDRVDAARLRIPEARFSCGNAEQLDFPDASFDVVIFSTVFSSVLDPGMRARIAGEADRVLRPGGAILWYDFMRNNPSNPHVRGVSLGEIDALFPTYRAFLQRVTLAPPIARRLGVLTPVLYPVLASVPLLRTHYIGLLVKAD